MELESPYSPCKTLVEPIGQPLLGQLFMGSAKGRESDHQTKGLAGQDQAEVPAGYAPFVDFAIQ